MNFLDGLLKNNRKLTLDQVIQPLTPQPGKTPAPNQVMTPIEDIIPQDWRQPKGVQQPQQAIKPIQMRRMPGANYSSYEPQDGLTAEQRSRLSPELLKTISNSFYAW